MRHKIKNRKLGRRSDPRRALMRALVRALFLAEPKDGHAERIQTTPEKAKEARRLAERLITLGKDGSLAARRRALALLPSKRVVRKLFTDIAPRYADRPGGYTRILRLARRRIGDAAPQVLFELVGLSSEKETHVRPDVDDKPKDKPRESEPSPKS